MPQARRSRLSLTRWDDCATFPIPDRLLDGLFLVLFPRLLRCKSLHVNLLTFYLQAFDAIDAAFRGDAIGVLFGGLNSYHKK